MAGGKAIGKGFEEILREIDTREMRRTQDARLAVFVDIPDANLAPDILAAVLPGARATRIDGRGMRLPAQLINQRPAKIETGLLESVGEEDGLSRRRRDAQLDENMIGAPQVGHADQPGAGFVHGAESQDVWHARDAPGEMLEGADIVPLQVVLQALPIALTLRREAIPAEKQRKHGCAAKRL